MIGDNQREIQFAVLCWCAEPLDHLWQRIQYVDERQNVLVQCVGYSSPFAECGRSYFKMMFTRVNDGLLAPLFWYWPNSQSLAKRCRTQAMCMAAQVWWRFAQYRHFPIRLAQLVDPATQNKSDIAQEFMDTPSCCSDSCFGEKVRKFFSSAESMIADTEFMWLLRTWSRVCRICNMHIERLLAQIKQGVQPSGRAGNAARPDPEKLAAVGAGLSDRDLPELKRLASNPESGVHWTSC